MKDLLLNFLEDFPPREMWGEIVLGRLHPNFIRYLFARKSKDDSWWTVLWCRWRGHPYGVYWYNVGGDEPDMTCVHCGDDLG